MRKCLSFSLNYSIIVTDRKGIFPKKDGWIFVNTLSKLQPDCCFGLFETPSTMRNKAENRGGCHILGDCHRQMKGQ